MREWLARIVDWLRRDTLDRELQEELRFHKSQAERDAVAAGAADDEARWAAKRQLGNTTLVTESARERWSIPGVDEFLRDVRYAVRGLRRSPGFAVAAIVTLAIGIGANTAVWSIVDALMLRTLPIDRPHHLHALRMAGIEEGSYIQSYLGMQRLQTAVTDSVRVAGMSSSARLYARVGEATEATQVQLVSGGWFPLLGVRAAAGRLIGPDDDRTLGGHPVAVLNYSYWQRRFGGDPAAVGKTFRLNGAALTVIGVAEPEFVGLSVGSSVDMWVPAAMQHEVKFKGNSSSNDSDTEKPWVPQDGIQWLTLVTRVDPSAAPAIERRFDTQFRLDLERRLAGRDSAVRAYGMREHMVLQHLPRGFSGLRQAYSEPLRTLMVSVGLVLLIACGNLACLLLARGASRAHEMSVRISLGARPGRLVRQVLAESLTLAVIGGAFSLLVARWGSAALLKAASGGPTPIPLSATLNGRVLAFAAVAALVTGLLFGAIPAFRAARTSLYERFRSGGRVANRLPLGRTLVAAQIALSLILVTSAGIFVKTFQNYLRVDVGYDRESVVAARVDVRAAGYTYEQLPALHQRLLESVGAVPGVRSTSLSLTGLAAGTQRISGYAVPGRTLKQGENNGQENFVTSSFFATVGMPLLNGRTFTPSDRDGGPRVAVISERTARDFFGTLDVVGKRFGYGTNPQFEVVGVVRDARVNNLRERPQRLIFYPIAQGPQEYISSIEARIAGNPETVIAGIRNAIAGVDRDLPLREVVTLGALLERGLSRERLVARLAGALGVLALLLVGVGLYGVIGYSVTRRTNEMGVRLALGASPGGVSWLVLRESLGTIALGLVFGAALWYPALRLTQGLVFNVSPHDPATVGSAAALMVVVGALAAMIPAWRASRTDPVEAIRAE